MEVGGIHGREALDRLRNVVGRVGSSWRPATAEEGSRSTLDAADGEGSSRSLGADALGQIEEIETIAAGLSVRERTRLSARFGTGRWTKPKDNATVRFAWGEICRAQLHWYEAHGIGRRQFKIKRFLE